MKSTAVVRGLAALVIATIIGAMMSFVAAPDAAANHGDVGTDNVALPGTPCPAGTVRGGSSHSIDVGGGPLEFDRCIFAPSSRLTTQSQCEAAGGFWDVFVIPATCIGSFVPLSIYTNGTCPPGVAPVAGMDGVDYCDFVLRTRHTANFYKPLCIEDSMLQGDAAFADFRINSEIQADASVTYFVQSGAGCTFDCADGFDANCDGKIGDFCRVEIDRKSVAGAGQCIAESGPAVQPLPPITVTDTVIILETPTTLAHTGAETSVIAFIGLGLMAFGTTAMGVRRRLS